MKVEVINITQDDSGISYFLIVIDHILIIQIKRKTKTSHFVLSWEKKIVPKIKTVILWKKWKKLCKRKKGNLRIDWKKGLSNPLYIIEVLCKKTNVTW